MLRQILGQLLRNCPKLNNGPNDIVPRLLPPNICLQERSSTSVRGSKGIHTAHRYSPNGAHHKWYPDAGTMAGNLHKVIEAIQTAIPALANFGLEVKPKLDMRGNIVELSTQSAAECIWFVPGDSSRYRGHQSIWTGMPPMLISVIDERWVFTVSSICESVCERGELNRFTLQHFTDTWAWYWRTE